MFIFNKKKKIMEIKSNGRRYERNGMEEELIAEVKGWKQWTLHVGHRREEGRDGLEQRLTGEVVRLEHSTVGYDLIFVGSLWEKCGLTVGIIWPFHLAVLH